MTASATTIAIALGLILGPVMMLADTATKPHADWVETDYSRWLAKELHGREPIAGEDIEVKTHDWRRADIVTDTHAIEVEWCRKKKINDAIEQSRYYATATGKRPAIILLVGRGDPRRERDLYWACCQIAMREGVPVVLAFDVTKWDTSEIRRTLNPEKYR